MREDSMNRESIMVSITAQMNIIEEITGNGLTVKFYQFEQNTENAKRPQT